MPYRVEGSQGRLICLEGGEGAERHLGEFLPPTSTTWTSEYETQEVPCPPRQSKEVGRHLGKQVAPQLDISSCAAGRMGQECDVPLGLMQHRTGVGQRSLVLRPG